MRICVVGLGKLGTPLAAILAARGHDVTGVDARPEVVELLNQGRTAIQEPGLAELIERNRSRLRATTDLAAAAADAEASFIVVPTPSTPNGTFSVRFVVDAIEGIGRGLRRSKNYHVVTVTSTVMPLSHDLEIRPALEATSGRIVGDTVGLCYNPEFIALGSVLRDMMHPDLVLMGSRIRAPATSWKRCTVQFIALDVQVRRMTWVNAEIAKIAVNTFVTTKISYANMLAELCEQLPGGDVDVVTGAIGVDRRIGHAYLRAAVRVRTVRASPATTRRWRLQRRGRRARGHCSATDAINRRQVDRLVGVVRTHATPRRHRVGVLGLAYKPGTPVVEESQGVMLANRLAADGFATTVFDPAALADARSRARTSCDAGAVAGGVCGWVRPAHPDGAVDRVSADTGAIGAASAQASRHRGLLATACPRRS